MRQAGSGSGVGEGGKGVGWGGGEWGGEGAGGSIMTIPGRTLVFFARVPGEIKRSRDLRGGRRSWTLNYAQKRS